MNILFLFEPTTNWALFLLTVLSLAGRVGSPLGYILPCFTGPVVEERDGG